MVVALLIVGVALQVCGVGLALFGLDDVKGDLFSGTRIPGVSWAHDAVRSIGARVKAAAWGVLRKLHLRKPKDLVGGGTAHGASSLSATLTVESPPLKLPRRDEERWPWALATLDGLRMRVDQVRNNVADQFAAVRGEHAADVEILRAEIETTAKDATDALAVKLYGNAGHGVNVAVLGIALALVGSLTATFAGLAL